MSSSVAAIDLEKTEPVAGSADAAAVAVTAKDETSPSPASAKLLEVSPDPYVLPFDDWGTTLLYVVALPVLCGVVFGFSMQRGRVQEQYLVGRHVE